MQRKTRSLLEELELLNQQDDIKHIVESRAINVVSSAVHLLNLIQRETSQEVYSAFEKKLLLAIKHKSKDKLIKYIRSLDLNAGK